MGAIKQNVYSFNVGPFMSDTKRTLAVNAAFALVLIAFLVPGRPVGIVVSAHRTMQECVTVVTEQKIPGNCYPADEAIYQDNDEIPAGL